jgi:3-oxoacyl-[acyl-carrier protein] reductase
MILENKIALITGASGGIGRAISVLFAKEGARVVLCDLAGTGAGKVLSEIVSLKGNGMVIEADVSDEKDVNSMFNSIVKKYGTLDILVNNAGVCRKVSIPDIEPDEWDSFMKINLKSVFLCSKEGFKIMKEKRYGKIINMGSLAAKMGGIVVGAHYSASKAGVLCFTKSLAQFSAPYDINVNAVAPGPVLTKMTEAWGKEINETLREKLPFKRFATPEDVAHTVLFLASDRSNYITGETINVNGGMLMD